MTVGCSTPLKGEATAHYTAFTCEYQEANFASSMPEPAEGVGHEGEDGVIGVRTVNDHIAIILYALAKIAQKRLLACALLDRALEGHLCLHTEVSSKLDEVRRAFIQLERHPEMYKGYFDVLTDRITSIVKNALDAQRSGALSIAEYVAGNATEAPDSTGTYRVKGRLNELEPIDTNPGGVGTSGLTEDERDQGYEFVDGVKIKSHMGMDLLRAVSTNLGPHVHNSTLEDAKKQVQQLSLIHI